MKKRLSKLVVMALCITTMLPVQEISAAKKPKVTKSMKLTVGQSKKIKVKGSYIKSKKYKTSNKKIVTVTKKGKVTAKKQGNCKITVTVKYKKSKKAKKYTTKKYKCSVSVSIKGKKSDKTKTTVKPTDTPTKTPAPSDGNENISGELNGVKVVKVSGVLRTISGEAITNEKIWFISDEHFTDITSDSITGKFTLNLPVGKYELHIGYGSADTDKLVSIINVTSESDMNFDLKTPLNYVTGTLQVKGCEDADISKYNIGFSIQEGDDPCPINESYRKEDGTYKALVGNGTYEVKLHLFGNNGPSLGIVTVDGMDIVRDFELNLYEIRGFLGDIDIDNYLWIRVQIDSTNYTNYYITSKDVDQNNNYRVLVCEPGTYTFYLTDEEGREKICKVFEVGETEYSKTVDLN